VDSFPYLKNPKACIGCGFCSTECPVDSIIMVKPEKTTVQES
jgi:NAD-dependent dihydropyrimidine dehydrogenase PreA subunit